MDWSESIKTDINTMAGGNSYYSLEEIYQEIKERLIEELKLEKKTDCEKLTY